jgi:hypothetical protein
MLSYKILEEEGIVIIKPLSPLKQSDFKTLTKDVDNYIEQITVIGVTISNLQL